MKIKNINNLEEKTYAAYEKSINIELFNKIIAFMFSTRNKTTTETLDMCEELEKKCIWYNDAERYSIQEEYKFQYFGELLERYKERIGSDIKDIRAIALALGYGTKLIQNNMIIGTQLVDFLSEIKTLARNDMFLKGALYLYDKNKYYMYGEELMNRKYTNTEDITFALSIFYERIDDFYSKNKNQIVKLVGNERNISVIDNIGIYAWLIKSLYPIICKKKNKDISLLKALIKVPTGLQIEGTTVYNELINNGYSKEEIIYLNYLILYYDTVPQTVRLGNSMVEEKIATNLCIIFINSEKTHDKKIYNLIKKILDKYKVFDIKCYGSHTIKNAIKDNINVVNPITFSELYYELDDRLFSFDILNPKWDIVATEADSKKYERIFDCFLLSNQNNKEKLIECIGKYNELTGKDYLESFFEYNTARTFEFNILVNKSIIILKEMFESILKLNIQNKDNHLRNYIKGVKNKKSFEFLKYLLRLNKYNIIEISEFGFEFECFISYYSWGKRNTCSLHIEREFLNRKSQKLLFDCLEKFIFYKQPDIYFGFLESVLKSDITSKVFKKTELRELYLTLCELEPETYKFEWLQEKYLTPKEIKLIHEQKRIEKEYQERAELIKAEKDIKEEFDAITEKGCMKNLHKFCDKYEYTRRKDKISIGIAKEYILNNTFSLAKQEIEYFIKLLDLFMKNDELTPKEFIDITYKYIKREVQDDEWISKAC